MAVVFCRACRKEFEMAGSGSHYCPQCLEEDEKYYQPIYEYLLAHPRTSAFVIMENFNISPGRLKRYLKEGKLAIVEDNNSFLKCEACDKPITTGRFCNSCVGILRRELKREITNYTYLEDNEIKVCSRYIKFR